MQRHFFVGHNARNCLLLALIVLHVIEFAEYVLANVKIWYIKFVPITALMSVVICQMFYNRLEEYGKYRFLSVSLTFWICSGICRVLAFISNVSSNLDLQYVHFTVSFIIAAFVHCLIICDFVALITQVNSPKSTKLHFVYSFKEKVRLKFLSTLITVAKTEIAPNTE